MPITFGEIRETLELALSPSEFANKVHTASKNKLTRTYAELGPKHAANVAAQYSASDYIRAHAGRQGNLSKLKKLKTIRRAGVLGAVKRVLTKKIF